VIATLRNLRARRVRFACVNTGQKLLLLEAAFWLLVSKLAVKLVPFRYWSRFLGAKAAADLLEDTPHCPDISHEVSQAIFHVNCVFRGRFTCLMQATAGKALLNRRGIPNTLVLGARTVRGESGELRIEAHAWLKCGIAILLGGEAHDQFTVVAQFRSPTLPHNSR